MGKKTVWLVESKKTFCHATFEYCVDAHGCLLMLMSMIGNDLYKDFNKSTELYDYCSANGYYEDENFILKKIEVRCFSDDV